MADEIQAEYLSEFRQVRQLSPSLESSSMRYSAGLNSTSYDRDPASRGITNVQTSELNSDAPAVDRAIELTRCFLRLANLPNFERLNRYEATLWRQAGQILYALDALDRRKPQERTRRFR